MQRTKRGDGYQARCDATAVRSAVVCSLQCSTHTVMTTKTTTHAQVRRTVQMGMQNVVGMLHSALAEYLQCTPCKLSTE